MDGTGVHADPGHAVVRLGRRQWPLAVGVVLTFGRGDDRDIRIGADPVDDYVSRRAGTLEALPDGILVRNTSTVQTFQLIAMPGPEQLIRPGGATTTMPHRQLRLVVPGRFGMRYPVHLLVRAAQASPTPHVEVRSPDPSQRPTISRPSKITPRERRMLAALCEPVLTLAGRSAATYREVAERLDTTPKAARTCLDGLRSRLADVDGIPGLRTDEDDSGTGGYLDALAGWALASGEVTVATLAVFDVPST